MVTANFTKTLLMVIANGLYFHLLLLISKQLALAGTLLSEQIQSILFDWYGTFCDIPNLLQFQQSRHPFFLDFQVSILRDKEIYHDNPGLKFNMLF